MPLTDVTLCVFNLPPFCSEEQLLQVFQIYGQIQQIKIWRADDTSSALVTFCALESAQLAKVRLDGFNFMGKRIKVDWATSNHDSTASAVNSIYVRYSTLNVEPISEQTLFPLFSSFGTVTDIILKDATVDPRTGRQSGLAFVHFDSSPEGLQCALRAVQMMDQAVVDGVNYTAEPSKNMTRQFQQHGQQQYPAHLQHALPPLPPAPLRAMPRLPSSQPMAYEPYFPNQHYRPRALPQPSFQHAAFHRQVQAQQQQAQQAQVQLTRPEYDWAYHAPPMPPMPMPPMPMPQMPMPMPALSPPRVISGRPNLTKLAVDPSSFYSSSSSQATPHSTMSIRTSSSGRTSCESFDRSSIGGGGGLTLSIPPTPLEQAAFFRDDEVGETDEALAEGLSFLCHLESNSQEASPSATAKEAVLVAPATLIPAPAPALTSTPVPVLDPVLATLPVLSAAAPLSRPPGL